MGSQIEILKLQFMLGLGCCIFVASEVTMGVPVTLGEGL
jgi:hypothetical protein